MHDRFATHDVTNQVPPLTDVNLYGSDAALMEAVAREGGAASARALNALHGIQGTAIEKGYNLVAIATDGTVVDHCVYTLANPCSAHLVERSRHWLGVSSRPLEYGAAIATIRISLLEYRGQDRRQFTVCGEEGTIDIRPLESRRMQLALSRPRGAYKEGYQAVELPPEF